MTECAARASARFARVRARFLVWRRNSASTRISWTSRRYSIAGFVEGLKRSVTREFGLLALVDVVGVEEVGVEGVMMGDGVGGLVAARRASMSTIWWSGVVGVEDIVVVVVVGELGW